MSLEMDEWWEALLDRPIEETSIFMCEVCHRFCTSSSDLEAHQKSHPYIQPDRTQVSGVALLRGEGILSPEAYPHPHGGEAPLQSRMPQVVHADEYSLSQNLLTHNGKKSFPCYTCGRVFKLLGALRKHKRYHEDEIQHSYGDNFAIAAHLKKHEFAHTLQTHHRCHKCDKYFATAGHLKTHELKHTLQGFHSCHTSKMDFATAGQLKTHELTHTLKRSHGCPHCDYRATREGHLRNHIVLMHTREFKHNCSQCGKGYITPGELKKHKKKAHQINSKI